MAGSIIVALLVVVSGGLAMVKLSGRWRRRRGHRRLGSLTPERMVEGIDGRVLLFRTPPWHGMTPGRSHRVRVDLLLGGGHLVVSSDQGVLADLVAGQGRPLRSVRCTGPGRLVIEGDVPRASGPTGLWRLQLLVEDAQGWAKALRPFCTEDGGGYGSFHEPAPEDAPPSSA